MHFLSFLNRLTQTVSYRIISISGYLLMAFELYSFFVWIPIEMKNSTDPEFGGLGAIIIVVFTTIGYYIATLIISVIGFLEYMFKKRNNSFRENKTSFFSNLFLIFFIIGLILPVIILILYTLIFHEIH